MQYGKVIVYDLRQFKDFKLRYPTHDLELTTIVSALKIWRPYLYGEKCEIFTYHKSLNYLFTQKGVKYETNEMVRIIKGL